MMLLTLINRLQLLANMSYIMKTLSNKADFKSCQYLDGKQDEDRDFILIFCLSNNLMI